MADDKYVRQMIKDTFFIHNCFGSFFSGVLDWFEGKFYQRFQYKVIGTYDKAVKFFNDKKQMGVDPSDKLLPSLSLDPMLDFSQTEQGGKFLWQHSHYAPGIGKMMFKAIDLKEQDVVISPVFSRYSGTFEITFWLSSVYELIDFRVALLQFSGGYNRWMRPEFFWSYLILPDEIQNFDTDKATGMKLDWSNSTADVIHVDSINKQKLGVPIALDAMWRLTSFGDASTKYGGDSIAESKLVASFEYEINIPTYLVLSRGLDATLALSFSMGKSYSKYPMTSPFKILKSISILPDSEKYFDSKYYKLFVAGDTDLDRETNEVTTFSLESISYPYKFMTKNFIVDGELLHYTDTSVDVHRKHILYFETYKPEFLPALRRCGGVICRYETKASEFFNKCDVLQKPAITFLSDTETTLITALIGQQVTLDPVNKKLYSGVLPSHLVPEDDPTSGYEAMNRIKIDNPDLYNAAVETLKETDIQTMLPETMGGPEQANKLNIRLLKDECDGIQTRFELGYVLDDLHVDSVLIYIDDVLQVKPLQYQIVNNTTIQFVSAPEKGTSVTVGGHFLISRDSKLNGIYEFTEADVLDFSRKVVVDLPVKLQRQQDIILVSYVGRMEYEKDYTLDLEAQTATILLKPIVGELVQLFYYVAAW